MSEIEEALLGYNDELATTSQHQENKARRHSWRGRKCGFAFIATLLIIFSTFLILYHRWYFALNIKETQITDPFDRDVKLLLHPEDHVWREPIIRHFVWNITRAKIAPDGVEKDVLLINSKSAGCHGRDLEKRNLTAIDLFPGPTIEARPGDTLEIEVFNFLDEGVSLHWHGLHMRGIYIIIPSRMKVQN
jgi:FtsP/CotA-like multicopper oxidase with cupredoxin domain